MMSADLITERISSTSSIRNASKICLYPSQTSTAVRTSSAPHTQKYWALLSSCVVASCMFRVLAPLQRFVFRDSYQGMPLGIPQMQHCQSRLQPLGLRDLRGHQIDQREDEHPHQVDKVPIESRCFDIMGIVVFR